MNLKEFFVKNRETAQLAYGVILMVLIPLLIVFNTFFIINKYNESLDVTLQRKALSLGRSVYSLIKGDLNSPEVLQAKISELASRNNDLLDIQILEPVRADGGSQYRALDQHRPGTSRLDRIEQNDVVVQGSRQSSDKIWDGVTNVSVVEGSK